MFAVAKTAPLPASAYSSDVTRDVYHRLIDKAGSRSGQGSRSCSTRPSRRPPSAAPRPTRRPRSASAGALSRSAPCDASRAYRLPSRRRFPTPTPTWRVEQTMDPLSEREDGRRSMLGQLERDDGAGAGAAPGGKRRSLMRQAPPADLLSHCFAGKCSTGRHQCRPMMFDCRQADRSRVFSGPPARRSQRRSTTNCRPSSRSLTRSWDKNRCEPSRRLPHRGCIPRTSGNDGDVGRIKCAYAKWRAGPPLAVKTMTGDNQADGFWKRPV